MPTRPLGLASLVLLLASGSCPAQSAGTIDPSDVGKTALTAIEVCMPPKARDYIARLRCPDGAVPVTEGRSSVGPRNPYPEKLPEESEEAWIKKLLSSSSELRGLPLRPGEVDYHVIDAYTLRCGATRHLLYVDMYHCPHEDPRVVPSPFSLMP